MDSNNNLYLNLGRVAQSGQSREFQHPVSRVQMQHFCRDVFDLDRKNRIWANRNENERIKMPTHVHSEPQAGCGTLIFLVFLIITPMLVASITVYFMGVTLEQNVTGKLKQAADANAIPLANEKLSEVIQYLESNHLNKGSTKVFIDRPENDLGFFYKNLTDAKEDLDSFPESPPAGASIEARSNHDLAESNQLMKLRETLLDEGSHGGTIVTHPPHLAVYPGQVFWFFIWWLIAGWVFVIVIGALMIFNWK